MVYHRQYTLCLVLAGCAMLVKEQGITVLGVCVLYDTIICRRGILRWEEQETVMPSNTRVANLGLMCWNRVEFVITKYSRGIFSGYFLKFKECLQIDVQKLGVMGRSV